MTIRWEHFIFAIIKLHHLLAILLLKNYGQLFYLLFSLANFSHNSSHYFICTTWCSISHNVFNIIQVFQRQLLFSSFCSFYLTINYPDFKMAVSNTILMNFYYQCWPCMTLSIYIQTLKMHACISIFVPNYWQQIFLSFSLFILSKPYSLNKKSS